MYSAPAWECNSTLHFNGFINDLEVRSQVHRSGEFIWSDFQILGKSKVLKIIFDVFFRKKMFILGIKLVICVEKGEMQNGEGKIRGRFDLNWNIFVFS